MQARFAYRDEFQTEEDAQKNGYESKPTRLGRVFYKAEEVEFGAQPQLVLTDFYGVYRIGVKEVNKK